MNVKFLIVLTIVLSSLFILPVNAYDYPDNFVWGTGAKNVNLGEISDTEIKVTVVNQGSQPNPAEYAINSFNFATLDQYLPLIFTLPTNQDGHSYLVLRSPFSELNSRIDFYYTLVEPTIEPTAQPTIAPDNDLSQYGEKKNFQIRNIDYSADDMLLIDGINLTIWYTDSNDVFTNKTVYQSNNAPSIIDLRVPIAGGLFVEYGINPNYEPVKIQTYPYLNNRVGYWITQELSNYENLYYQYYDTDNPLTDINYGITLIDGNTHLPVSNAAISMDGGQVQYTSNYGGTTFKNITQGLHTFRVSKNGYNALTFTKEIYITSSIEIEFFPISVNPTATITPSPIKPITPSPTISPIDKPTSILESVSYGLAKVFGVKTVDNANYIFALLIILFPAAIAGGITHQALGFIAGGMLGFVFALTIGLVPIWTFFAMCLLAVIYIMLIRGNEGF